MPPPESPVVYLEHKNKSSLKEFEIHKEEKGNTVLLNLFGARDPSEY